jgi:outer membrane protein assembly factor BamB
MKMTKFVCISHNIKLLKIICILYFLFILSSELFSQIHPIWARIYESGAYNKNYYSINMDIDSSGNIYVTGWGKNGIILKYNSNGQLLWSDTINGVQPNFETKFSALSESGNLYVVALGWITQSQGALFLIKYNNNGNRLWVKTYNDTTTPTPNAFMMDDEENIYITGTVTENGYNIGFSKYDSSGSFLWSRYYYNPLYYWHSEGTAIIMDTYKNIYIAGYVNADPPYAHYNSVIVKYDTKGNQLWAKIFNDSSLTFSNQPVNIICDKQNNVIVGLNSVDTSTSYHLSLWPPIENIITLKYSTNGDLIWNKCYSGTTNYNYIRDMKSDKNDNIYISASVGSSITGGYDYGTIKYDSSGNKLWENRYTSPATNYNIPNYMYLDDSGNSYITGGLASIKIDTYGNTIWTIIDSATGYWFFGKVIKSDYQNNVIILGDVTNYSLNDCLIITKYSQVTGINNQNQIVSSYKLFQNYPNPFNPTTNIKYSISENGKWKMENGNVVLKVFDILGREVKELVNEKQNTGNYEIKFDGTNLSSGIYFYSLFINGVKIDTKKLMLLK